MSAINITYTANFIEKNIIMMTLLLKHSDELFDTEGSMYCKRYFKTKPNSKINGVEIYRNKKLYKTFKNDKLLAQFYFQNRFKIKISSLMMLDF